MGDLLGPKHPTSGKLFLSPAFNYSRKMSWDNSKKDSKSILVKKKISAIGNTVIHDAENIGLVPILELTSEKESTMDRELVNCNKVYDIATYNTRQNGVTIEKNNVKKPPYIQIRLFTAKENEAMKQVAYANYILNEFKELSQILGDFVC